MKKQTIILAISAIMALPTSLFSTSFSGASKGSKNFNLNNAVNKNQITFHSKTPVEDMDGSANEVSGAVQLDPSNIESATGNVSVAVKSMTTAVAKRDEHMRAEDWLDAEKYPAISFKLKGISGVSVSGNTASGTATGEFSMHGVTKTISVPVKITYIVASEATKKRASGDFLQVQGEFAVALRDFNVSGSRGTIGKKVGESISIKLSLFANSN